MPRTLLIVESPNKARKIQDFLGGDTVVRASVGHVCDLPEKDYGVDLATLEERYEVRNAKVVGELRALVRGGGFDRVLLATDPDREGEAIAWHLARELKLGARDANRVEFREITAAAVRAALASPRPVDDARVDAQRSRRVLDRVVGFDVSSEICWPAGASSAGRVQTPALHLLCEREREILAFEAATYFTLGVRYAEGFEAVVPVVAAAGAERATGGDANADPAATDGDDGGDDRAAARGAVRAFRFPTRDAAEETRDRARPHPHVVRAVDRRRTQRRPDPPYTTSTLQQDASRKLRLGAKQTADLAQALFDAGYITYHRTDSVRVSDDAAAMARARIAAEHPDALPERAPVARTKAGAQDAHEAIRPTKLEGDDRPPPGAERLYALIKARFLASQCRPALVDRTTVWIDAGPVAFAAEGAVLVEPGFLRYWAPYARQEDAPLPAVEPGQVLGAEGYAVTEKQTSPPPRYDTGALIRKLEVSGIGRPATFASIIETLLRRGYVVETTTASARGGDAPAASAASAASAAKRAKGNAAAAKGGKRVLQPTALGLQLDGLLTASFPTLVSEAYTAGMEAELDRIERRDGETRPGYLRRWYAEFRSAMGDALRAAAAYRQQHGLSARRQAADGGGGRGEETATQCDRCGEATYRKLQRRGAKGAFLACPACRLTRDVRARTRPNACKTCGSTLIERRGKRKGVKFWGCVRYGAAERPCTYAEFEPRAAPTAGAEVADTDDAPRPAATGVARAGAPPESHDAAAPPRARKRAAAGATKSTARGARKSAKTASGVATATTAASASVAPRPPATPTDKRCPRCERATLDVVGTGPAAAYCCPGPGCGFALPVGARRRAVPCPRCGGTVLERRGTAASAWACARAGCDYRLPIAAG